MGSLLEQAIGALNGAVGDYLARTRNGLATELSVVRGGRPVPLDAASLRAAFPDATPRVAVLAHGLMCSEDVWEFADGGDYGTMLQRDLGVCPLVLRYNSGLSIPENGARLSALLEALLDVFPARIEQIILIGYSMGGLVVRSACHDASVHGRAWLSRVERGVYVGTPHLGAPLERAGRVLARALRSVDDPVTRLVATLADLRSDGIKDLGDADLRHEDRARREPRFSLRDPRHPVPLLDDFPHFLIAGSRFDDRLTRTLFGDLVVTLPSATAGRWRHDAAHPIDGVAFVDRVHHVALAHDARVYEHLVRFCGDGP